MKNLHLTILTLTMLALASCGPDMLKAPVNNLNKSSQVAPTTTSTPDTVTPADSEGNCICTYNYAPVCGSDGATYGNSCVATCKKVPSFTMGECAKPVPDPEVPDTCVCPFIFSPVCGSDKNTYGNSCVAKCNKITSYTAGKCGTPVDACVCPLIYSPVCGSDKKTYSNSCLAKCNQVTSFSAGKCAEPNLPVDYLCKCPFIYSPVCGSNKKTYPNSCSAKCNMVPVYTPGKCLELFYPEKLPLEIENIKIKIPILNIPFNWELSK